MSMRECRERWNSVGGRLSGLWTLTLTLNLTLILTLTRWAAS